MNFNANAGTRHPSQGLGRKVKRVSDVNAVGPSVPTSQYIPSPYDVSSGSTNQYTEPGTMGLYSNAPLDQNFGYVQTQHQQQPTQHINVQSPNQFVNYPNPSQTPQPLPNNVNAAFPPQFAMFQQPIVQDMAVQYGQKLADQGKQLVENQFEKWISVISLKYYFAVDNKYVINKLRLIFFPFTHTDWSLKYDQDSPVQPRYDINAPDLYIPTMAYITYVVLAGLMLGMQDQFSPEQLGIQASRALAFSIFELIAYSLVIYVANISTNLKTLDFIAFAGYKFVVIVACMLTSIPFHSSGYYIALLYCCLSLGFFLLRTLKTKILHDAVQTSPAGGINYDSYGVPQPTQQFDYTVGRKRKLYLLFLIVGSQAFLTFWLSKHLTLSGFKKIIHTQL